MKVISIVGMGGVGKTALAQQLYNDPRVVKHFDARAWICVPQRIDEIKILREILRSMNIYSSSYLNESLDSLRDLIISRVSQKRFLLVLDDLWDPHVWERVIRDLLYDASEYAVLVTIENEDVELYMNSNYIHFLRPLMVDYSWELLRHVVLSLGIREIFEEIGRKIVYEAKGVPLSIKCIGGMLRSKLLVEEWESVLYKLQNVRNPTVIDLLTICYQDLPTSLKRCFCYCLIFPEDVSEIDADKLVRMWLAHGYLGSTGNDYRLEERGHEYVTELANRSFFQALDTDDDGKIKSFSIHYLLHELLVHYYHLQFRTFDYRNNGWLDVFSQLTCRHLTILSSTEPPSSSPSSSADTRVPRPSRIFATRSCPRLRTFFAQEMKPEELQPDLFYPLSYLRVLSLCGGNLSLVPVAIWKLIYLRYLDLSCNPIEELPEFICGLCNLETIDLQDCLLFKKLPSGLGKLIMLRHLLTRNTPLLQCFPDGLQELSKLRTLGKFMVGQKFNKFRYLKNLNNLEGTLELEFYELDDEEVGSDAEEASLKDKIYLRELKLSFNEEMGTEVSEAFEAPPNLMRLYVYGFRNKSWSNWISAQHNYLKELKIKFCTKCLSLPPLWRLPSLEILDIDAMMAMRNVSLSEFLGMGRSIDGDPEVAPSGTTDIIEVAHSGREDSPVVAPSDTKVSTDIASSQKKGNTEVVPSAPSTSCRVAFPMLKK